MDQIGVQRNKMEPSHDFFSKFFFDDSCKYTIQTFLKKNTKKIILDFEDIYNVIHA